MHILAVAKLWRRWASSCTRGAAPGTSEANRARMRYPAFRAAGLPVGSGEVESSCGTVAGRLRRGALLVAGRPPRRVLQKYFPATPAARAVR